MAVLEIMAYYNPANPVVGYSQYFITYSYNHVSSVY